MRTRLIACAGTSILLAGFLLVGCGDDDDDGNATQSVCAAVDCGHGTCVESGGQASCECDTGYHAEGLACVEDATADVCAAVDCGHGTCVDSGGQASCECDTGYHAEGLACVEDAAGNTPPQFTSTPPTDATEMVSVTYDVACSDVDGDALVLAVDSSDTCGGDLVDNTDGTGSYTFMVADAASTPSCVVALTCSDGTELALQTQAVTVHASSAAVCADDPSYLGQLDGSDDPSSNHGGTMTTEPWDSSYDAGLDDLVAVMPANGSSLAVNTPITEATIIAVYEAQGIQRMYVADANAAFKVFLATNPTIAAKTGMRVSFTVTEISQYNNVYEITQVDDNSWTVDATGVEVPVKVIPGGTAIAADDFNWVIRTTGTLVSDPVVCGGGFHCYDLDYGAGSTVVFRTAEMNVFAIGSCVTFQGPVTLFNGGPQLTTYGNQWFNSWELPSQ
jgi:hypothetical protein